MTPAQYALDGRPVRNITVRIRYDSGPAIVIRAGSGMAEAIVRAIEDYREPAIPGMGEASRWPRL